MNNSYVYFIEAIGTDTIKIGVTTNMKTRVSALSSSSPFELCVVYYFPGSLQKEKELHKKFNHLRVNGEWFKYTDEIKNFISALKLVLSNKDDIVVPKKRKKKLANDKLFCLRMPSSLYVMLEAISEDKNIRVTSLVRNMLEKGVKEELDV